MNKMTNKLSKTCIKNKFTKNASKYDTKTEEIKLSNAVGQSNGASSGLSCAALECECGALRWWFGDILTSFKRTYLCV